MATELLKGDVAVVTGAGQGNGAAIARGLAEHGAAVALIDRNADTVEAVAREITAGGHTARAYLGDVSDAATLDDLAERISRDLGDASVLVNNAGILRPASIDEEGFDDSIQAQFSVNVLGTTRTTRAFLPQLRRTHGRIVNLGSVASFLSVPAGTGYAASKGAILQITRTLAAELATEGVRVNAISPGVMVTPLTEDARNDPTISKAFLSHTPMARYGDPEELVGPVVFLASGLSSFVTGVMLPVDGGYLVH